MYSDVNEKWKTHISKLPVLIDKLYELEKLKNPHVTSQTNIGQIYPEENLKMYMNNPNQH